MIRPVEFTDLEVLRIARNKWYQRGLFRQDHYITPQEQIDWFDQEENTGFVINESAYGKVYNDNEIAFYGFDVWKEKDLKDFMREMDMPMYYGECYLCNPYLTWWLDAGYKVSGHLHNRKYWNGEVWGSLLLRWDN